jgi:hypothetical protein
MSFLTFPVSLVGKKVSLLKQDVFSELASLPSHLFLSPGHEPTREPVETDTVHIVTVGMQRISPTVLRCSGYISKLDDNG